METATKILSDWLPQKEARKRLVYIAGPYTAGDVAQNVRHALIAADAVYEMGDIPLIPHLSHFWHLICPKKRQEWLEIGRCYLERCDALLRLPGLSLGADEEEEWAKEKGIPVFHSVRELRDAS